MCTKLKKKLQFFWLIWRKTNCILGLKRNTEFELQVNLDKFILSKNRKLNLRCLRLYWDLLAVCMIKYSSLANCQEMLISICSKLGLNPNGKIQNVPTEASGLLLVAERLVSRICGLKLYGFFFFVFL